MSRILIVEDEEIIRNSLRKLLERNKYDVDEAGSVDEAKQANFSDYNLVISDLRLPGGQGTDLIELASPTPVLIMTSYASMRSAVDAMKLGAVDYIAKPFDHKEMLETVARLLSKTPESSTTPVSAPEAPANSITDIPAEKYPAATIIGNSQPMLKVFENIEKVAPTDTTVLIYGETGTGKELVASDIHRKSPRNDKTLISVNCASIPESMIESELFGHEKGAFQGADSTRTGLIAAADGGTLFLDEIGELPLEAQARLLRVLQENEVRPIGAVKAQKIDLRLIAATQRNLDQLCEEGKFREDLLYRIKVFQINLPPLKDRQEDLQGLVTTFIKAFSEKLDKPIPDITPETWQAIHEHTWPGNIRELKNAIERAVILNNGNEPLQPDHLDLKSSNTTRKQPQQTADDDIKSKISLDEYFVSFVLENQNSMSETQLAKTLGISRKNLWERRQKLGIPRKKN